MSSSREEIKVQRYYNEVDCNLFIKFQLKEVEENNRWDEIVEEDNVFCFDRIVWEKLLKMKPIIRI
jgi:hypothetical protein